MISKNRALDQKPAVLTIFSMLLGFAAVATTVAFLLIRISLNKAYEKKWRDYDDCGIL